MSIAQIAKNILGHTERLFGRKHASNELLVICMHSTPADRLDDFKRIVEFLDKQYVYLQANEIEAFFSSQPNQGPYYTLTYDDGLLNNYPSALWLAEQGKRATYFVVPDFIESTDQAAYYQSHIRPVIDRSIDHENEDVTAMSWQQLKTLQQHGHMIGAHSASHRLNHHMKADELHYELVEAKSRLEKALETSIRVFASPNNTLFSVNKNCAALINQHYDLHYITVPGSFVKHCDQRMIYRRNIEVHWNKGAILFALGIWDLGRWEEARIEIQSLLNPQE